MKNTIANVIQALFLDLMNNSNIVTNIISFHRKTKKKWQNCNNFNDVALRGGYELIIRDLLMEKFRILHPKYNYIREAPLKIPNHVSPNIIDLKISTNSITQQDYFIELGHNYSCQPDYYLTHHAYYDIIRALRYGCAVNSIITVEVLTSITQVNNNQLNIFANSYRKGIVSYANDITKHNRRLTKIDTNFNDLDPNTIRLSYPINYNGFSANIIFYISSI